MPHDIIDNRAEKLVDHLGRILDTSEAARFAVGYFFLSGLEAVADRLSRVRSLRLLIGNTTSRETIEQLAEGCRRLDLARAAEEEERLLKPSEQRARVAGAAENVRRCAEVMDQTDEGERLVRTLADLIEQKLLQVRVYTRGRLHAKAYICDYAPSHYESGIAIVGSSNLSLAGLTHNTELNVVVHGSENHARLVQWFDELWADAQDFEPHLLEELRQSWAAASLTPYDIYMKTLHALVADRLEEADGKEILWDDEVTRSLADFQKVAVRQAIQTIRDHGGVFVADVVGLGKSYIGAAIVKHFERVERRRALIICPASLTDMWEAYNEQFQLNARVLSMGLLRSGASALDGPLCSDRDFVLVDESHNFRHHSSQRYDALQSYLARENRRVCLLTATPRNRAATDVYHQIKLFHPDDVTLLPIDPPNLKEYFREVEAGRRRLQDLLVHVLIRRTRKHILRYYGITDDAPSRPMRELSDGEAVPYLDGRKRAHVLVQGKPSYFPQRKLETLRYSIEETYAGLYDRLRGYLGRPAGASGAPPRPGKGLTYARYGLWHYVLPECQQVAPYPDLHRAGMNLRGLVRVMLFKRFESSVHAFRRTLERLERIHRVFLLALDKGFVPAGEEAQELLYESDTLAEADLVEQLRQVSDRYRLADFDATRLRAHIDADRKLIREMLRLVRPIGPDEDAKLQVLQEKLRAGIPKATGKVLLFTQYAETAQYLFEQINPGGQAKDIDCVFGTQKSKARTAARFAPKANPQIKVAPGDEVRILIATDVMSEGLNLQDGDVVVNYDLHWNPVRLIQRFGRIDRIGSQNDVVWGFNFLPEKALEKQLGLQQVLKGRIKEIHETIGEDAAILDIGEQINDQAMFAIYEQKGDQLSLFEDQEDDLIDINEAEEMLRSLRQENPEEFQRIASLRDGIRSARGHCRPKGRYVMCAAGRYQQLFLLDEEGAVVSRETPAVLGAIKCSREEPPVGLPAGYNAGVMEVLSRFADEVKQRRAQQRHSLSLTAAQSYVLRELRAFHAGLDGEGDLRAQVAELEQAFRRPVEVAIRRELCLLRRNGVTARPLVQALTDLYHAHGLGDRARAEARRAAGEAAEIPHVVCSEALR